MLVCAQHTQNTQLVSLLYNEEHSGWWVMTDREKDNHHSVRCASGHAEVETPFRKLTTVIKVCNAKYPSHMKNTSLSSHWASSGDLTSVESSRRKLIKCRKNKLCTKSNFAFLSRFPKHLIVLSEPGLKLVFTYSNLATKSNNSRRRGKIYFTTKTLEHVGGQNGSVL